MLRLILRLFRRRPPPPRRPCMMLVVTGRLPGWFVLVIPRGMIRGK